MKYIFLIALAICLTCSSTTFAQGGFFDRIGDRLGQQGREILQQEFGTMPQRQQPDRPRVQGSSIPSEGGKSSNGQGYQPWDGGFDLPNSGGGQPFQPDPYNQGGTFQPNPSYQGQPRYQNNGNYVPQGGQVYSNQADLPGNPVSSNGYVLIRCPQGTQGTLNYTLSSNRRNMGFSMSAGQEQRFRAGSKWMISFFDGSQQKRHDLQRGRVYLIKRNAKGLWQLFVTQ